GGRGGNDSRPPWSRIPPKPATRARGGPASEATCTPSRVLCSRSRRSIRAASPRFETAVNVGRWPVAPGRGHVDVVVWMFAGAVQGKAVECGDGRWRPAGAMRESAGMGSPVVPFETAVEWAAVVERGPDGSAVRPLARLAGLGSVATFELPGGVV